MLKAPKIIILARTLSKSEEQNLLDKDIDSILLLNQSFAPQNEKLANVAKLLSVSQRDHSERHIERIVAFGHKKLINGESIAEKLSSKQSSDWYFLRFSLFQRSRSKMVGADEVNQLLETIDPKAQITLYHLDQFPIGLLNRPIEQQPLPKKAKKTSSLTFLFTYAMLFFYRALSGNRQGRDLKRKATKMIIANPYLEQEVIDLETGELKIGDPHLHTIIDQSLRENDFIYLTQLRPPSLEANHQLNPSAYLRKRSYDSQSIYFEPFLFKAFFSKRFSVAKKRIQTVFDQLEKGSGDLSAEDRYLMGVFLQLKRTLILAKWREIAAEDLWNRYQVKKVLAIDEHSLQNRSIFTAAKTKEIETFALQHGAISRANVAYRYSNSDKAFAPWPDHTFIRGLHTQQHLEANHYPTEQLELVGHLRTDVIPLLKSHEVSGSKVIYATQPLPPADRGLKQRQLSDFLKLVKHFPKQPFVIKPHPNESEKDHYHRLAADPKYANLSVYEGNLYQLLASGKLLITYYSTVGLEAIYFDKEVICLDYEKRDLQAYHQAQVAHRALNGEELIMLYEALDSGQLKTDEEAKKSFISARAYKIDGNATQRVMAALFE